MPQHDKLYCAFYWIRASGLCKSRPNTMTLIEGGVSSPDITLHLGCGTMKPAIAHPLSETSRIWLNFFTPSLKTWKKMTIVLKVLKRSSPSLTATRRYIQLYVDPYGN